MENNVQLILSTDKVKYSIGESVSFKYTLKNIGKQDIMILPWGGEYSINWLKIYNLKMKEMKPIEKIIYELKIFPDKNDFILLKPDGSFLIELKGILKEGETKDYNGKTYKGLYVDFENSAILLEDGEGEYLVRAKYIGRKEWKEEGLKKFNFTNVFEGMIISSEIKLKF